MKHKVKAGAVFLAKMTTISLLGLLFLVGTAKIIYWVDPVAFRQLPDMLDEYHTTIAYLYLFIEVNFIFLDALYKVLMRGGLQDAQ